MNAPVKVHLTQQGFDDLQQELAALEDKHPAAVTRVTLAREMGDLSENSEYHAARDDLEMMVGRMEEIKDLLNRAVIVKKPAKANVVDLGCKVTVSLKGKEMTYEMVGEYEADPTQKKISLDSPLGKALVGRKVKDTVEFEAPVGKVLYTIKKIH